MGQRTQTILLVVVVLLLGFLVARSELRASGSTWVTNSPAGWRYRIESVSDAEWEDKMATIGAQGWELVFARRASKEGERDFHYEVVLKQPRTPF